MNKFIISEMDGIEKIDPSNPVLYYVFFGDKGKYYLHKSKTIKEGCDKFLDDVFRGIRGKNFPEMYSNVVDYCKKFPSLYKVSVKVEANLDPDKLLKYEAKLYKLMKNDSNSLNNLVVGQFKPEWMLRHALAEKCVTCLKSGIIAGKKESFNFCPKCGRANKKVHPSTVKQQETAKP